MTTGFRKNKEIKEKVVSRLLISRTLTFNNSATICPIQIIFSVPESVEKKTENKTKQTEKKTNKQTKKQNKTKKSLPIFNI